MTALLITSPYPSFLDSGGKPLENGYVYIGQATQNPETHLVSVYWDAALTIPAAQPIRTIGGYPSRNGSPGTLYVDADDFSITLRDKNKQFVFSSLSDSRRFPASLITGSFSASQVSYKRSGLTTSTRTQASVNDEKLSVFSYFSDAQIAACVNRTGALDMTNAMQNCINEAPVGAEIVFPAGLYIGYIFVWRGDISLTGAGSASVEIRLPASCPSVTVPHEGGGNVTGLPNVIEVGQCALGNSASPFQRVNVKGFTINGNYSNNTAPTMDLFGHGMIVTATSYCDFDDLVIKNCYLTGFDNVINSNYNKASVHVENCGNAFVSGAHYPNFDVNSSKYCRFDVVSLNGYYGGRMLDNCWGNHLDLSVYNPNITGFVHNNQTVNTSYANTMNVTVIDGCNNGQGASIGDNVFDSIINISVNNAFGTGVYVNGSAQAYQPRNNQINITTRGCGGMSTYVGGLFNQYKINSRLDGDTGPAGSVFAVDINGSYNQLEINVEDGSTPQVRGVVIRLGAQYNHIVDFLRNVTVQDFLNQDTSNTNRWYFQYGESAASGYFVAATLNSGWGNTYGAPYVPVQYGLDAMGRVSVRGVVTGGTGVIFTLPAGYRPQYNLTFPTNANGAMGRLLVATNGDVTLATGTATNVDLSTINFYLHA